MGSQDVMLCHEFDSLKLTMYNLGRSLIVFAVLVGIWAFFIDTIEIVIFQRYLADGSVVDRIDECGTIFQVLTGGGPAVNGAVASDQCVGAARVDTVFGGALFAVAIAAGSMMISSSHHRPAVGMDTVRPLPSRVAFWRRQDAHQRRASELAERTSDEDPS